MHLSSHFDETAEYCKWHVPESHFLESWGDARAFDGTTSIVQPLIAPLYSSRSAYEFLAAFSDNRVFLVTMRFAIVCKTSHGGADFEKSWRKALNDGVIANTTLAAVSIASAATLPRDDFCRDG